MFKSKAPEKDQSAAANLEEVMARAVQQQHSVVEHPLGREPMTKSGTSSCIGSGMSIVGNIDCNGPAQVFGRIKGEVRASDLLIGDGAQIEGSVIAQDVTVCGHVKGTIRAVRVKLQDGGAVAGDIFHRSLSIDENSLFEGSSRRPPGETAVVIVRPDELPALVGLCRLPLGMERVEGLFQAVLGRFPGIDGATKHFPLVSSRGGSPVVCPSLRASQKSEARSTSCR
jgi:cytoskeletal protein CcmA (bactofilin family)